MSQNIAARLIVSFSFFLPRLSFSRNDGFNKKRKVTYNNNNKNVSYSNPFLNEGQLILGGSIFFNLSTQAISKITAPFQGLNSAYRLIELIRN